MIIYILFQRHLQYQTNECCEKEMKKEFAESFKIVVGTCLNELNFERIKGTCFKSKWLQQRKITTCEQWVTDSVVINKPWKVLLMHNIVWSIVFWVFFLTFC